jgi:hypothetical protein
MFGSLLKRGKVRAAVKNLSADPSAKNYSALARAHAASLQLSDVRKVCEEGLVAFPADAALLRLRDRAETLQREDRVRDLQRLLKAGPRTAYWKELCEIHLRAKCVARAEQVAAEWFRATQAADALCYQARARAERYFSDRRRDDARRALELADQCLARASGDARPLRLQLSIYTRCGAWNEARRALARLLELYPGDPGLEARFRTAAALAGSTLSLDAALREVERTGQFEGDDNQREGESPTASVRPLLKQLAAEERVQGAFFVRGSTALVQGPKGATAERQARGVRELLSTSRAAARRLGLGQALEINLEGDFGVLSISPSSAGAAALWTDEFPSSQHLEDLAVLAGFADQAAADAAGFNYGHETQA